MVLFCEYGATAPVTGLLKIYDDRFGNWIEVVIVVLKRRSAAVEEK